MTERNSVVTGWRLPGENSKSVHLMVRLTPLTSLFLHLIPLREKCLSTGRNAFPV